MTTSRPTIIILTEATGPVEISADLMDRLLDAAAYGVRRLPHAFDTPGDLRTLIDRLQRAL